MTDEKLLQQMKKRPTLNDIAKPNMNKNAKVVFRVAMARAKKDQDRLLKKASAI